MFRKNINSRKQTEKITDRWYAAGGVLELFSKCWVQFNNQTRVDRNKPRNLEFSLWFMDFGLLLWTEDDSGLPTHHAASYYIESRLAQPLFLSAVFCFLVWFGLVSYKTAILYCIWQCSQNEKKNQKLKNFFFWG